MAGSQGLAFWLPWFWRIQDRSWSCGLFLSQHSDHNNTQYHPDVNAWDMPQVEKQDGYDIVLWQQISNFDQHFLPFFSDGQWLILDDICPHFSTIACFRTSQYIPLKSHLIVIYFSLLEFLVATAWQFCFAWLLQFRSSSCAESNSSEGGDIKSKSCSLFMINDHNFLLYKIRFCGNFCHVFSKTRRRLFSNLSCIQFISSF